MKYIFTTSQHKDRINPREVNQKRRIFTAGILTGIALTLVMFSLFIVGAMHYLQQKADQTSVFAIAPDQQPKDNRVQLYFPLEKFLAWRSTAQLQLGMINDRVVIHLMVHPFTQIPLQFAVSIFGTPNVYHGYFMLSQVHGTVDGVPLPTSWLLTAIADEGAKYGVHVNDKKDTLYIEKTFGAYRLVGYDMQTKDLIISLPVQTVEHAAQGQVTL
ncbi:hypothetical protein [Sulfoacidibacillus thermotolerans]|uniref:Uncharacterized protein n=1 Tax=Sulfoacidibacillus thermotolerans TaxID=1765684 RepID=A0A2U3D707_SULT2|nr:hypothetical protein [Sulfoacidibacillus thermotolerans]PWI57051.1 hypothetical protein BM613_10365 [Sulfoacidibacillus thermotolerans]